MKRMETKPIFFIAFVNMLTANVFSECKACIERVLLDVTPPPTTAALLLALGSDDGALHEVVNIAGAVARCKPVGSVGTANEIILSLALVNNLVRTFGS
jgi:hypothetical protein